MFNKLLNLNKSFLNSGSNFLFLQKELVRSASNLPKFRFTIDGGAFSDQQRKEYEENGFVVIENLVSDEKLEKLKRRFQRICNEKIKVPIMTVMRDVSIAKSEFVEGEQAITKVQDFVYDDELFEFCTLPEILQYVKSVAGANTMAMHTMLINKPPGL